MNGPVHFRIIHEAVRYAFHYGNNKVKRAFKAWEKATGRPDDSFLYELDLQLIMNNAPLDNNMVYYGIDLTIGAESYFTDHYFDMALRGNEASGNFMDYIYDSHNFTSFNHFLSLPWPATSWSGSDGYYYFRSSQGGDDHKAILNDPVAGYDGKLDKKDIKPSLDHSPILNNCKSGWLGDPFDWGKFWDKQIRYTIFVPVHRLAYFYYQRLMRESFNAVVEGNNHSFKGIYLLGPVLHAVADACVPQHVISAMGYRHQQWEDALQGGIYSGAISLDPNLVSGFLEDPLFETYYESGELANLHNIEDTILRIGQRALHEIVTRNSLSSVEDLRSEAFWDNYMSKNRFHSDAVLLYNLAIAGTVRVMTDACFDVVSTGGGDPSHPIISGFSAFMNLSDKKKKKMISRTKSTTLYEIKPRNLLGFTPKGGKSLEPILAKTRNLINRQIGEGIPSKIITSQLAELESAIITHLKKAKKDGVKGPDAPKTLRLPKPIGMLRKACGMPPINRDIKNNPEAGLYTFRIPTAKEYLNPKAYERYLREFEANRINVDLIRVSRCIAFHKFLGEEKEYRARLQDIKRATRTLEKMRDILIRKKELHLARRTM